MSNKVKMLVVVALIVILAAVLNLYTFLESGSTTEQVQLTSSNKSTLQAVQQQIDDFYLDTTKDFLNEELSEDKVAAIKTEIDNLNESTLDKNELTRQLEEVVFRYEAQEAVNNFYPENTPAIKGDKVSKNLTFKEDLTLAKVETTKEKYYFELEEPAVEVKEEGQENQAEQVAEPQLDAFQLAVNEHIDFALENFEHYEAAKKALADVEAIEIEDGQIGLIAQAMQKFEKALAEVKNPAYQKELDQASEAYIERFIEKMQELVDTIPQYYDLALIAVEPSKRLTEALKANEIILKIVEESSQESSEASSEVSPPEIINEVIESEEDWYWTPPESTWTPPVSSNEPPIFSEPEPEPEPEPELPVSSESSVSSISDEL